MSGRCCMIGHRFWALQSMHKIWVTKYEHSLSTCQGSRCAYMPQHVLMFLISFYSQSLHLPLLPAELSHRLTSLYDLIWFVLSSLTANQSNHYYTQPQLAAHKSTPEVQFEVIWHNHISHYLPILPFFSSTSTVIGLPLLSHRFLFISFCSLLSFLFHSTPLHRLKRSLKRPRRLCSLCLKDRSHYLYLLLMQ